MKNVWKGLTVGAVVGAAVGIALDAVYAAGRDATEVAARARTGAKHLAEAIDVRINEA